MSYKNQIIILLFVLFVQYLRSEHSKYRQIGTKENPFVTNSENILARYIVKEQEELFENDGEKPSDLWLEHQRRRFPNRSLINYSNGLNLKYRPGNRTRFSSATSKNNSQYLDVININTNHLKNDLTTHINNDNRSDNKMNVFSYTERKSIIEHSETKSDEEIESENINNKFKIPKKNLKENIHNIDDKILMDTSRSSENMTPVKSKPRLNKIKPIHNMNTPSFRGFLEFLKSVQDGLLSKAKNGIQDKITRLKDLRDTILLNIEDRLTNLWPDKTKQRDKRSIFDESTNHETFPSAETALMTISFLTFAVFLVKLVLQIINTFKSRHYSFNGFTTTSNIETLRVINSRKNAKFIEDDEENIRNTAKIVSATENYKHL